MQFFLMFQINVSCKLEHTHRKNNSKLDLTCLEKINYKTSILIHSRQMVTYLFRDTYFFYSSVYEWHLNNDWIQCRIYVDKVLCNIFFVRIAMYKIAIPLLLLLLLLRLQQQLFCIIFMCFSVESFLSIWPSYYQVLIVCTHTFHIYVTKQKLFILLQFAIHSAKKKTNTRQRNNNICFNLKHHWNRVCG